MEFEQLNRKIKELEKEIVFLKEENTTLKKKAAYFDEQLKYSKNFFYRFDVKKQRYDYISNHVQKLTGLSVEEFLKKTESDAQNETHPEDIASLSEEIKSLHESKDKIAYKSIKYRRKLRNKYIWIRDDINAIKDDKGNVLTYLGTATNITKEKEFEARLQEEKQLSQEILDSNPNIIYVKDTEGKFILINKSMANIFEEDQDVLLKRLNSDYESFEYECDLLDKYENDVLNSGKPVTLYERFISPSRKKYWLHTIKSLLTLNNKSYLLVNSTDLTLLRESEIKLKNRELTFKGIINATKDLIFLINKDLKLITANQSAASLSGYGIEQMIGKNALELFGEKLGRPRTELALKVLKTKQIQRAEENHNGVYVDMVMYPILDDNGEVAQIAIMVKDITPIKKAEVETRKALQKEIELSELKSGVLSTVSHEFRTPLAIILSNIQQLKMYHNKINQEEFSKKSMLIENSIKHMNYMLNNISVLDKSDRDLLHFEPRKIDVMNLIQQLVQETKSLFNEPNRIVLKFHGNFDNVVADETLIRHILLNLLTNSLKYSSKDRNVKLSLSKNKKELKIQIRDYGIGISKNDLKNIWEPFYRGSNVSNIKGTGLGATIVKKCVELHSGTILIDSKQNEGTLIKLFLPYQLQ